MYYVGIILLYCVCHMKISTHVYQTIKMIIQALVYYINNESNQCTIHTHFGVITCLYIGCSGTFFFYALIVNYSCVLIFIRKSFLVFRQKNHGSCCNYPQLSCRLRLCKIMDFKKGFMGQMNSSIPLVLPIRLSLLFDYCLT